ncbi:MAG: hypothetical protein MJK12_20620 [Colwellia sp.]|nr:hypothetical protein [Colwellia sp.]
MKILETAATEIACEENQRVNGGLSDEFISKEFCLNVLEKLEQKAPGFNINQYVNAISKAISEKMKNEK